MSSPSSERVHLKFVSHPRESEDQILIFMRMTATGTDESGMRPSEHSSGRGGLSAGVELGVDPFQAGPVDVGVDLGGGDGGVAQQLLDHSEIGAGLQKVGGEGVAKGVGRDPACEPGPAGRPLNDRSDDLAAQRASRSAQENQV